ncbi:hypothetical protein [Govanella unica]|uniref:Terminase n=1 Tax=Govanella unica TaxID=2975056 RepID=A0A9X3U1V3_9PROT|nr:hypothetical protein [Govania unica]MDA5194934.1 terminase [Govania unica]
MTAVQKGEKKAVLWTLPKRRAFLKALRQTGTVTVAAEKAGVSRGQAYQFRKKDKTFRQAWDDALQAALDELETELRRRAMQGVEQPVYFGGKECGRIRTYNDNLGMFLLRAHRGEVYGAAKGAEETAGSGQGPRDEGRARRLVEERLKRLAARRDSLKTQGEGA